MLPDVFVLNHGSTIIYTPHQYGFLLLYGSSLRCQNILFDVSVLLYIFVISLTGSFYDVMGLNWLNFNLYNFIGELVSSWAVITRPRPNTKMRFTQYLLDRNAILLLIYIL